MFKEVAEAYEVLSDPQKRKMVDQYEAGPCTFVAGPVCWTPCVGNKTMEVGSALIPQTPPYFSEG